MSAHERRINAALQRREREDGKLELTCLPLEIQLEATNRCRQACPTCARNFYDREANAPGEMSAKVCGEIAKLFPFAESVLVGGYGEPLLAEITYNILQRANKAGCRTAIITGGGDLDLLRADKLTRAKLSEIIVSIDGASDETNLARRGVTLSRLLDNLAALRMRLPELVLIFNVTLQVDNLDELPGIVDLAVRQEAAAVRVFHQKIYSRTQTGSSVFHVAQHAEQIFAQCREKALSADVELDLPPLSGSRPCQQPYRLLAVRHDGTVHGCCSALFESQLPGLVLGKLPQDDPYELWNAPAMQTARQWSLGDGPADSVCADCAFRVFSAESHTRILDGECDD